MLHLGCLGTVVDFRRARFTGSISMASSPEAPRRLPQSLHRLQHLRRHGPCGPRGSARCGELSRRHPPRQRPRRQPPCRSRSFHALAHLDLAVDIVGRGQGIALEQVDGIQALVVVFRFYAFARSRVPVDEATQQAVGLAGNQDAGQGRPDAFPWARRCRGRSGRGRSLLPCTLRS